MPNHSLTAWWKYNPIYQKPTTLEPVVPWSYFYYFGPDPAAGVSYGQYRDDENQIGVITEAKETVYSPVSGNPMVFVAVVPEEDVKAMVSKATADTKLSTVKCCACQADLVSDHDLGKEAGLHCVACGSNCSKTEDKTIKGKTMGTQVSREERIKALKQRIQANVGAKKAAVAPAPAKDSVKEKIRARIEARVAERKALAKKAAKKVQAEEDFVSLDQILKAMNDGEQEMVEEKAAAADEAAPAEEAPAMPEEKAAAADEAEDEEQVDLDMVVSMLKRKERLEKAKRQIRARLLARKKAVADAEEAAEEKKEEKAAAADEAAPAEEAPAEKEQENPLPAEQAQDMEAMKFEPLASLDRMKAVVKDEIDMALFGHNGENPTWNVTVAGVPVARIQLKNQSHAEDIRNVFISDDYAADLVEHCAKAGFVETMKQVNADFWANHTSNAKIAARFKGEAANQYGEERKKLLASYKQDFFDCLNIVCAGVNKNFYPDLGNVLKEALFTNLTTVGLPEQTATSSIEKAFAENSASYFDSLFKKAEEYLNLSREARSEIAKAVSSSNALDPYKNASLENSEPATLSDRVARASMIPQMQATANFQVNSPLSMDVGNYKSQLKQSWKPGR